MAVRDRVLLLCRCNVQFSSCCLVYILLHYIYFHKILRIAYTIYSLDPASHYTHVVFPHSNPVEYTFPKVTCNFYQNVWLVRIWNIFDFEIQAFDLYVCNCEDYHNHPLELPHHFYFWFRCQRIFAVGSYNTMLLFSFCIVLIVLFQIESITTIITNQDNVFESYKPLKVISRLSS
jgi:hypothetical protein